MRAAYTVRAQLCLGLAVGSAFGGASFQTGAAMGDDTTGKKASRSPGPLKMPPGCVDVTSRKLRPPAGFRDVTLEESGTISSYIGAEAFRRKQKE
jgi:hypothetical protein